MPQEGERGRPAPPGRPRTATQEELAELGGGEMWSHAVDQRVQRAGGNEDGPMRDRPRPAPQAAPGEPADTGAGARSRRQ